jgi:hypothetical protein
MRLVLFTLNGIVASARGRAPGLSVRCVGLEYEARTP